MSKSGPVDVPSRRPDKSKPVVSPIKTDMPLGQPMKSQKTPTSQNSLSQAALIPVNPLSPPLLSWWHQSLGSTYDEAKDASRPVYRRNKGELGIYLTLFDAEAVDQHSYGLEHYFYMDLTERLYGIFSKSDVIELRRQLYKRGVLDGAYIERFEPGIVLVISVDDVRALETLWSLYKIGKLGACMQEVLVTPEVLRECNTRKIQFRTKLWEDEFRDCKKELMSQKAQYKPEDIRKRELDLKILEHVKEFQKKLSLDVTTIRDLLLKFEKSLGEFILTVKYILPGSVKTFKSLAEFNHFVKEGRHSTKRKLTSVDLYYEVITKLREIFNDLENEVMIPLQQIHMACESDRQQSVKAKIFRQIKEMKTKLHVDNKLSSVHHPEWSVKIMKGERELFRGLISLVPLVTDAAIDVYHLLDEYFFLFD